MMDISRRNFLVGTAAVAVAPALPALAEESLLAPYSMALTPAGPIFQGAIGEYHGVIIRMVPESVMVDLRAAARQNLRRWAAERFNGQA